MEKIEFYKYQGTGNDFILVDDRNNIFPSQNVELIHSLCQSKFGIGADGLILLRKSQKYDFAMWYANSNGKESTMCGNGGRCIAAFAQHLGIINGKTTFEAKDGIHEATYNNGYVELKMQNVEVLKSLTKSIYEINTGSPHLVSFVISTEDYDVLETGRNIQQMPEYPDGINVNFVEDLFHIGENNVVDDASIQLNIRTYERGVEDETLSCGTGAVASALCSLSKRKNEAGNYAVKLFTLGGELLVKCNMLSNNSFDNIFLCGPTEKIFKGEIEI